MLVSIIIPTLNEEENILRCLACVKSQQCEFEVLVVDGGSSDSTRELARRDACVIESVRGRAIQMNVGARHARGELLLFLHADSILPTDALIHLRRAAQDPMVVGGTFTLSFDSDRLLLKLYSFFTRFRFRYFHYGDQGIFVKRAVFEQMRGYREIPFMEDVDFLKRLYKTGRVVVIKKSVTTSARRFLERGLVRQQLLNCLLVSLYVLGVKPEVLVRWYKPKRSEKTTALAAESPAPGVGPPN